MATFRQNSGPLTKLLATQQWDAVFAMLLDTDYLESRVEAGHAFELGEDFLAVLSTFPKDHPRRRVLRLVAEALLRDLYFIAARPSTLFQCLWNNCWWYDCSQAAAFYSSPVEASEKSQFKLCTWMEEWRSRKEAKSPRFRWLRSLRPPNMTLGSALCVVAPFEPSQRVKSLQFVTDKMLVARSCPSGASDPITRRNFLVPLLRLVGAQASKGDLAGDPLLSPEGRWRVAYGGEGGGWGKPVRLLDAIDGSERASFPIPDFANISCAAISADGRLVVAGGYGEDCEGHLMIWDAVSKKRIAFPEPFEPIWSIALARDGDRIAIALKDRIEIWDRHAERHMASLFGHMDLVTAMAFSDDGDRLASAGSDGYLRVWDLAESAPAPSPIGHPDTIVDAVFSTDGSRLVTLSTNGTTWLWNGATGEPISSLHRSNSIVQIGGQGGGVIFVDRERVISFTAHAGGIWNAQTGALLGDVPKDLRFFSSSRVTFAPGGEWFAFHYGEKDLFLCRLGVSIEAVPMRGHEGRITDFTFSADGRRLAATGTDGTVRIWEVATGSQQACLRGHNGTITCIAFAADGRRLASAGVDRCVRIWNVDCGDLVVAFDIQDPGVWSRSYSMDKGEELIHGVETIAFTADGERIITLSTDNRFVPKHGPLVRIWNPWTGMCVETIDGMVDLPALAAGLPTWSVMRGSEVVIVDKTSKQEIAWLPCSQSYPRRAPVTDVDGRVHVIVEGRQFLHIALEGR